MDNQELLTQIAAMMEEISETQIRKIEILIENNVTKRIDSLFDGYKLTHEKQYELERRIDMLEQIVADLQNRIA